MTDNEKDILSSEDEQLLQSFFASQKVEIADDGFSEQVMKQIPTYGHRRLERWWSIACLFVGVVFLVTGHIGTQILNGFLALRMQGALVLSHAMRHLVELLSQGHNLWMILAGTVTLLLVWGYNEIQDARL